jgi:hypothetical protein
MPTERTITKRSMKVVDVAEGWHGKGPAARHKRLALLHDVTAGPAGEENPDGRVDASIELGEGLKDALVKGQIVTVTVTTEAGQSPAQE